MTSEFNRILRSEYGVTRPLPSVFIDTFFDPDNPYEVDKFSENTNSLLTYAESREPFECKDIKIALTEIRQLHKQIERLNSEQMQKVNIIQSLLEEVHVLNQ